MANIAFRASSSISNSNTDTLTVTAPAGTTIGDLVILCAVTNAEENLSDNNGSTPFTEDYEAVSGGSGFDVAIYSRRIQSGDPGSYTIIKPPGTTRMALVALTFQNPDPSTIYDIAPTTSTDTITNDDGASQNATSQVSTRTGCIHIITASREVSGSGYDSSLSGYTRELTSIGDSPDISIYYKILGAAGATGAQTITASSGGTATTVLQSFILLNASAQSIAASAGSYIQTGLAAILRVGSYTYLRHRK